MNPFVLKMLLASPKKPEKRTIEDRILEAVADSPWLSATQIAKKINEKASSVSSALKRMSAPGGPLIRKNGKGPRGGYGYFLKAQTKTRWDHLSKDDWL